MSSISTEVSENICPMSNHNLKILTYISQRARGINRNISHNRHRQQALLDLGQEQFLCNSDGSRASGTYVGLGRSVSRDGTNVFSNIYCT